MIRHGERQPSDNHIGERLAGDIHTHPETVCPKEHAARRGLELLEQSPARRAAALHKKIEFLSRKKFPHLIGYLLHAAIIGEKNKRASIRFLDKVRDPMLQRFLVTRIARVWHFLHDEHFHLRAKIERTPDQQRFGFLRANTLPEIGQVRTPDRQRRARHDAAAVFAKNHATKDRRKVDRRRIEREKLRGLASALDPIDMFAGALFQENDCAVARITNPPAKLLQFRLERFIIGTPRDLADARLQPGQMFSDRVRDKLRRADTKLAAFSKIGARFNRGEKLVHSIDQLRRQSHTDCVARDREETLACSRIVEPLDC